jgi:hypothetical protein
MDMDEETAAQACVDDDLKPEDMTLPALREALVAHYCRQASAIPGTEPVIRVFDFGLPAISPGAQVPRYAVALIDNLAHISAQALDVTVSAATASLTGRGETVDGPTVLDALASAGIPKNVCAAVLAAVRSLLKHTAEGDFGRIDLTTSAPDDTEIVHKLEQLGLSRADCFAISRAAACVRNGQRVTTGGISLAPRYLKPVVASLLTLDGSSGWETVVFASAWSVIGLPDKINAAQLNAALQPAELSGRARTNFLTGCRTLVKRAAGGAPECKHARLAEVGFSVGEIRALGHAVGILTDRVREPDRNAISEAPPQLQPVLETLMPTSGRNERIDPEVWRCAIEVEGLPEHGRQQLLDQLKNIGIWLAEATAFVDGCSWLRRQMAVAAFTTPLLVDWGLSKVEVKLLLEAASKPQPWRPPSVADYAEHTLEGQTVRNPLVSGTVDSDLNHDGGSVNPLFSDGSQSVMRATTEDMEMRELIMDMDQETASQACLDENIEPDEMTLAGKQAALVLHYCGPQALPPVSTYWSASVAKNSSSPGGLQQKVHVRLMNIRWPPPGALY